MEEAEGDKRNCKRLKMDISWTYDEISLLKESGNSFPGDYVGSESMIDPTCRIKKIMQYLVRALGDDSNRIKLLKQKLEVLYANAIENEHKAGQHVEFFDDNNKIWRIGSIVSMRKKCQELVLSWQGAEVIVQRGFVRKLGRSAVIQKKLEYEKRQKHQAEVIEDLGDASKGKRSRDDMVQ